MKHVIVELLLFLAVVLVAAARNGDSVRHEFSQQRHWEETTTETIWRDRYTNCDYGYYVVLPSGVIAHGSHSPNPNHGFLVSLPDIGKTSEASVNDRRFIWVNAEYNMSESQSLRGVANYQFDLANRGKATGQNFDRKPTTLGGLSALRFGFEYGSGDGRTSEEEIVAFRPEKAGVGIVYEIGLRTGRADFDHDNQWFERIRLGFKLLSLPQGECSND